MSNPILDSTNQFMQQAAASEARTMEAGANKDAKRMWGVALSLRDMVNLSKGIKYIASADSFSAVEQDALYAVMTANGCPDVVLKHVQSFSLDGVTSDHVAGIFNGDVDKNKCILRGALQVAIADGLSDEELQSARAVGGHLGLSEQHVDALVAEVRAKAQA